MAVNLSMMGNGFQFLDTNGLPLNAGKLYTYQAGSSTPLTTYTDVNGLIANTNPIILGTDGRPPSEIWLSEGYYYKFVLKDSNDVTIATYDNLYGALATAPVSSGTTIPTGVIVLWSGSIGSVPSGWYLCNGSNGTPDLRDKFIVGAGSAYAVNATGGSADTIIVSHTHTYSGTTASNGDHTHGAWSTNTTYGDATGFNYSVADSVAAMSASSSTAYNKFLNNSGSPIQAFSTEGAHTHTYSGTTASTGTSGTGANLPPYYALAYIMKG